MRLRDNDFAPEWRVPGNRPADEQAPVRSLSIQAGLTERVLADRTVSVRFETAANALTRDYEEIRIARSLYTALGDIVVSGLDTGLDAQALVALNETPRTWQLDVVPAGNRREIPSGFEQAVPGMLVMFTLLVLLTTGATMLVNEREQGLLRRLASAPISRAELVAGKWGSRMLLAAVQVSVALLMGTLLFRMDWGPDPAMVVLVLACWAGFCASAGLWLGTVASTRAQASGLGVLAANALAALGGCWWPIEITPAWMQALQGFLPTGWTMNALHELISFRSGPAAAIPDVILLLVSALVVGWLAVESRGQELRAMYRILI